MLLQILGTRVLTFLLSVCGLGGNQKWCEPLVSLLNLDWQLHVSMKVASLAKDRCVFFIESFLSWMLFFLCRVLHVIFPKNELPYFTVYNAHFWGAQICEGKIRVHIIHG